MLIRGVPGDENAQTAIMNVAMLAEVKINDTDILSVHQLHNKNKDPCVLVQFADDNKKREFVKSAKARKINTQMYGYSGDAKPIYVDEQLTKESFLLFKRAKNLKKLGVKFVWISNGNILVRETPNDSVVQIKSIEQVNEIEQAIMMRNTKKQNEAKKKNKNNTESSANGNEADRMGPSAETKKKKNKETVATNGVDAGAVGRTTTNKNSNVTERKTTQKQKAITVFDDEFVDASV